MISVEEAKQLVEQHTGLLQPCAVGLNNALGYVLSQDIVAPVSLPPFPQSAMDGYALCGSGKDGLHGAYKLVGEIRAGDETNITLKEGEAVRIFTGAMVPEDISSVVRQEDVTIRDGEVLVPGEVKPGSNIRHTGDQIQCGEMALGSGTVLTPACIGFLAGLGLREVNVYPRPRVGLVVTGSELVQPGHPLRPGQIYESNSATLAAALESTGFSVAGKMIIGDDFERTVQAIGTMAGHHDIVIMSGGISVGDYDFVKRAMEELHVETVFYKINQKPGKPAFFGKRQGRLLFALPGNPSAALLCYYQYVFG